MNLGVVRWAFRTGLAWGRGLGFPLTVLVLLSTQWFSYRIGRVSTGGLGLLLFSIVALIMGGSLWGGEAERALRGACCPFRLSAVRWFWEATLGRVALLGIPVLLFAASSAIRGRNPREVPLLLATSFLLVLVTYLCVTAAFWSVAANSPLGAFVAGLQVLMCIEGTLHVPKLSWLWAAVCPFFARELLADFSWPLVGRGLATTGVFLALGMGVAWLRRN